MIFFRYQNTKTLERNSNYVDMRMLYNEVIYRRSYYDYYQNMTLEETVDNMYDEFSTELKYRKNLDKSQYREIITKVCEIASNSYTQNQISKEEDYDKIDELMSSYPLDGIFVTPEHCEEFPEGTKYSLSELRSEIICRTNTDNVKYLAIYTGEVISKNMICGGTLIKPSKILEVLPIYKGAKHSNPYMDSINHIYRDIDNEEELKKAMLDSKNMIKQFYKASCNIDTLSDMTFKHVKEAIIRKALSISKGNYKNLNYRFKDNRHLIEITCKRELFKFCIFNSDACYKEIMNKDSIKHEGFYIIEDLFNNKRTKERLKFNLSI